MAFSKPYENLNTAFTTKTLSTKMNIIVLIAKITLGHGKNGFNKIKLFELFVLKILKLFYA